MSKMVTTRSEAEQEELLEAISILCDDRKLGAPIKQSFLGGILAFITCFSFGILLGPIGLAIGGSVGGIIAYFLTKDKFRPASDIIATELTAEERKNLVSSVKNAIGNIGGTDAAQIVASIYGSSQLQGLVFKAIEQFFANNLHKKLIRLAFGTRQ